MKKRATMYRIFLILIFCIVIYNLNKLSNCYDRHLYTNEYKLDREVNKRDIKEDRDKAIKSMEGVHPIFLDKYPKKYIKIKRQFIKETNRCMTVGEFQLALSKYLSSIEDGHTGVLWIPSMYLDINWKYTNDELVIFDENNKPTKKTVTKINNIKIHKIIDEVDRISASENFVGNSLNRSEISKYKLVLMSAGVDCSKDIIITIKDGYKETKEKITFIKNKKHSDHKNKILSNMIDNQTMYIKLGTCEVNEQLYQVIEHINKKINKDLENVIIDVRDNGGGTSEAGSMILNALKFKHGNFGSIVRYSPLAQSIYPNLKKDGYDTFERNNSVVKNEDINLFIITNENTFSSAQWIATWVKDGNLGTIVGKPSSNRPSSFGDGLRPKLENSGLEIQISYKKWLRPDASRDNETVLMPDINVEVWENPIDVILKTISNN